MPAESGQVLRTDLVADFDGVDDIVNVFQHQLSSSSTVEDATLLSDLLTIMTAIATIIKGVSNLLTVWNRIRVTNHTTNTLVGEAAISPTIAGTVSGDSNAPGVSACVLFKTNIPRVVLRKFLGPVSTNALTADGRLGGGVVAVMTNLGLELLEPQVIGSNTYTYGYDSPKALSFVVPTIVSFSTIPAYQRRRRQGVGA